MFPFESRWAWLRHPGYLHLVEAIESSIDRYEEPYRTILKRRAGQLQFGVRVRGVVLFFLNIGLLATAFAWLGTVVPIAGEVKALVETIAKALTGFSLLLTALFVIMSRFLGQLQADVIASMALGTGGPIPGAEGSTADLGQESEKAAEAEIDATKDG